VVNTVLSGCFVFTEIPSEGKEASYSDNVGGKRKTKIQYTEISSVIQVEVLP